MRPFKKAKKKEELPILCKTDLAKEIDPVVLQQKDFIPTCYEPIDKSEPIEKPAPLPSYITIDDNGMEHRRSEGLPNVSESAGPVWGGSSPAKHEGNDLIPGESNLREEDKANELIPDEYKKGI